MRSLSSHGPHAPNLREKARQLRVDKRLTIDELADRLALSRSTVYYWVRDLPIEGSGSGGGLPPRAQKMGTRVMQQKFKRLRDEAYEEAWMDCLRASWHLDSSSLGA